MNRRGAVNPVELGRYLTQIRERAGLKQANLPERSHGVLRFSPVEAGDRPLATEELETILSAIGLPNLKD